MKYRTRVAIIGAGPAGIICSYLLAKSKVENILVEKNTFPREKVCGDLLMPDSIKVLKYVGLYEKIKENAQHNTKMEIVAPNKESLELEVDFLSCRRKMLDSLLVGSAQDAGAQLLEEIYISKPVYQNAPQIKYITGTTKAGEDIKIFADLYILSTGAALSPLKSFSILTNEGMTGIAVRKYMYIKDNIENKILLCYDTSCMPGYGWINPVSESTINVGCGIIDNTENYDVKNLFHYFMKNSKIKEFIDTAESISELKGAPLRVGFRGSKAVYGNMLVIGESLGLTLPLLGEGMGKAMESGREVAEVVIEDLQKNRVSESTFRKYEVRMEKKYRAMYTAYYKSQKTFHHPWFINILFKRAKMNKDIKVKLEKIIREEILPTDLFSIKGLLTSMM